MVHCVYQGVTGYDFLNNRASDFFQDCWAEVTHGAKNGESFSEMMGPSISK